MHEFTKKVKEKGWTLRSLAERWKMSVTHLGNIAKNPDQRAWDALDGLKNREKKGVKND